MAVHESWTTYSKQERKLQTFHLQCLHGILGITRIHKVTNIEVFFQCWNPVNVHTVTTTPPTLARPHSQDEYDGHIPKDLLYGQLATGERGRGRPHLHFKDVCKCDLKACNIDTKSWESFADNRTLWKQLVAQGLEISENTVRDEYELKRARRTASLSSQPNTMEAPVFICQHCLCVCKSRIGLYSHMRHCSTSSWSDIP